MHVNLLANSIGRLDGICLLLKMLSVHRFGACSCFGRFCTSAVHQKQFSSYTNIGDKYVRHVAPNSINWYPGHMQKGLKAISTRLAQVDVIIELHDARIPFTGRCQFVKEASQVSFRWLMFPENRDA